MEEFGAPKTGIGNQAPSVSSNIRIEGILGRGGMGTVYRATHLSLDRVVAVKIINPEFAANPDIAQRFAREARLMAKLRHPRAAMIYDSGTLPDGRLYIVMEYVEGVTLSEVLEKEGRLSYSKAVNIAANVCDVLSAAHVIGIIHRDLKPANIMLNKQGVFVLDFGIAKMLDTDNAESMKLSMTGTSLIGTPFYMSPEQCLGQPVEARSDLYSLGALLYEMLAGRPPFNDQVLSAVIVKHAMIEPPNLEEFCENIPPALANVIKRLLAKKPEDRPVDAAEAKLLLENSIAAQTSPVFNVLTQTNSGFENTKATQHFQNPTDPLMAKPLVGLPAETSTISPAAAAPPVEKKKSGLGLKIIGLVAAALLLVAGLSIGTVLFLNWRSAPVAAANTKVANTISYNNNAANSMTNMGHMDHNMPMGNDFAEKPTEDKTSSGSLPIITEDEADKAITKITSTTEHRADGWQIIKTPKDSAIVCIHNMIEEGKTHMFAIERPNPTSQWGITARVSLDVPEFHGTNWTFEPQDVDGDGFEEVVFFGTNADHTAHRWLIYSPRTRQNYTVLATYDANEKLSNAVFSPNALAANGEAFHAALDKMVKEHK